jgi:hypothetical protein
MNDIITIGSFLIAVAALFRTFKKDRKEEVKNKKALICAKGYKAGNTWTIEIWNDGLSTARNIRFVSNDIENDERTILLFEEGTFPYPLLNSGERIEIHAALCEGRNPVPIIKFIWDDEYKTQNEREQVLSF